MKSLQSRRIFAFVKRLVEIPIDVRKQSLEGLQLRAGRAIEHLREVATELYLKKDIIAVNSSGGGATGLVAHVEQAKNLIRGLLGFSRANEYMKYEELGIKPAPGAEFPAFKRQPPTAKIEKWLRRGRIAIPDDFKTSRVRARHERARERGGKIHEAGDSIKSYAYVVARNMKKRGRPALRIIERAAKQESANITKILQQNLAI